MHCATVIIVFALVAQAPGKKHVANHAASVQEFASSHARKELEALPVYADLDNTLLGKSALVGFIPTSSGLAAPILKAQAHLASFWPSGPCSTFSVRTPSRCTPNALPDYTDFSLIANPKKEITNSSIPFDNIRCIFSDVDGTLAFEGRVSDDTIRNIKSAMEKGLLFFPATGRTRAGMDRGTSGTVSQLFNGRNRIPGVYLQGLMVFGQDGGLLWERFLDAHIIEKVVKFSDANQLSPLAYCGDDIYTKQVSQWSDVIKAIGDGAGPPQEFPEGLDKLHASGIKTHKMVLVAQEEWIQRVRPLLQAELEGIATLTQALPGLLEVLPLGSSKGDGVLKLLDHIGVSADECVAFGDAENDLEMLKVVGVGIAVENAKPRLKEVARFVTDSNAEDGVAKALNVILKALENRQ